MRYRILGRTGLRVSEIGFGAWGIGGAGSGWVGASETESVQALQRAIELGVNFIDTARGYGESERIVGKVMRSSPSEIFVATKVPPLNRRWPAPSGIDPMEAFPGSHIRASLETSLSTSGLEAFDILQFHVWSDDWVGRGDWLETIADLKQEGKIRFFGVSINDYQPENALALIASGALDTVQVIYNIFHQQPRQQLLPACADHNIGVIVRVALDEGGLTGRVKADTSFPDGDFRARFFRDDRRAQVEARVDALVADLGIRHDQLAETALRYALAPAEVSTVIPGMRTVTNVERNAAVSDGQTLAADSLAKINNHAWERNFYE